VTHARPRSTRPREAEALPASLIQYSDRRNGDKAPHISATAPNPLPRGARRGGAGIAAHKKRRPGGGPRLRLSFSILRPSRYQVSHTPKVPMEIPATDKSGSAYPYTSIPVRVTLSSLHLHHVSLAYRRAGWRSPVPSRLISPGRPRSRLPLSLLLPGAGGTV